MNTILKTRSFLLFKALIFSALAIFSTACSKTTESIGNGLLSEADHIGTYYTDTLSIVGYSQTVDTLVTKGISTVLLGSMMDPVMGLTNANLYTQLHLSSTNHYFGDAPVIDSVVLQLSLSGYYGDTTTWQTVHVHELMDTLGSSETYYHFSEVEVTGADLANSYQFRPYPRSTGTVVGTDTLTQAVIRIPLSLSFGEQLAAADSAIFSSTSSFKEYFHGLRISCESVSANGAICYLNPTDNTNTQLQVYYRETPESNPMRYYFYITSDDAYFNQYQHDYTLGSADFVQQVIQGDTAMGQQKLYLQSMGGVRCFLTFPDLLEWAEGLQEEQTHLIINEAKLIFPGDASLPDSSTFTPPTSLALLSLKEEGGTSLLPDYLEGSNYYGGSYSTARNSVTFRISEYLQSQILGNDHSQGLYLSITGASYNARRWVIAGPESGQDQALRCEIKYSIVRE